MATYFDPDRDSKIDYTNIKKVLDDALPGYAASGGTFKRPVRRYGLHHMRAIVRDHNHLLLTKNLKDWAASLAAIQDADIRQEFFRIQSEFAEIIHQDVLRTSGQFYLKYQPSNSEIDTTLQMQADNARDFMTIMKDGDFIHAPVP